MNRLKRSKTDVTDLIEDGQTPAKPKRGFLFTKLTGIEKKQSRPSIDKRRISGPIIAFEEPKVSNTPTFRLSLITTPPSGFTSSFSNPGVPRNPPLFVQGHGYSQSDPTLSCPPPRFPRAPSPPPLPVATSFERRGSGQEGALESIPESPFEFGDVVHAAKQLKHKDILARLEIIESARLESRNSAGLVTMEAARLQPPNAGTKMRAIDQATEMQTLVAERAKRSGEEPPPYEFSELIGKGAYGRVFKGKNCITGAVVAVKIIDIDKVDYEEMTTKNLSETIKEINILQQLRDSKARPYVNIIEQAMSVHNELWIISEYASGGSVNTLMKPTMSLANPGLEEKFVIPIARELALGLKFIHEAGVLHRDLKCRQLNMVSSHYH
jgi:protein-serine/threonine kinase